MSLVLPGVRAAVLPRWASDPLWLRAGQVPALDLRFKNRSIIDAVSGITPTFTRPSAPKLLWNGSAFETYAADVPGFELVNGVWQYVHEPSATNLIRRSEEFNVSPWADQGTAPTITANAGVAPNGATVADRIVFAAADSRRSIFSLSVTNGVQYALSVFALANSGSLNQFRLAFNDGTSQFNSLDFTASSTEWIRYSFTLTSGVTGSAASFQIRNATNNLANNLLFWGAQLETGPVATSPIITAGSAATRSADTFTLSSLTTQPAGVIYVEGSCTATGTQGLVSLNDNTANELLEITATGTDPLFNVVDGGVSQASIDGGTIAANTNFKIAAAYGLNAFAISVNGAAPVTDTSGTIPTFDRMFLGRNQAGNIANARFRRVVVFPDGAARSRIQQLSAA